MPITPHPTPLYTLTCDTDECAYPADIDGDGRIYFESPEEARTWALGWGWARDSKDGRRLLCPTCAVAQQDAADEAAEIAAAVQHALDLTSHNSKES
ncbi:hypothetical protein ACIPY6_03090 [Streptomyces sp. NPDC090054]|uniref:hypothetical protein n=1 Tax=Streptomyces sp. NPDC090054 TaxID=3365933 RepID=UPI00381883C0